MNTVCFPSLWVIHGLTLPSSPSPTPRFLSKGKKNQENDKRESVYLCSFQCNKSPMTGQLNDCWECSGDTARVGWYYCVHSLPQSVPCDGEGNKGNEPSSQRRQQGPELWIALLQPEHLHSHWLGDSLHLGPSCTSGSGHRALWRLGSLVLHLSFSGSNVIWSDTKEEPLDWNVLLNNFQMMAWNGCSRKVASQLWGEVPLASTLSHLTRSSSTMLCIQSVCILCGHLLAWEKGACSS